MSLLRACARGQRFDRRVLFICGQPLGPVLWAPMVVHAGYAAPLIAAGIGSMAMGLVVAWRLTLQALRPAGELCDRRRGEDPCLDLLRWPDRSHGGDPRRPLHHVPRGAGAEEVIWNPLPCSPAWSCLRGRPPISCSTTSPEVVRVIRSKAISGRVMYQLKRSSSMR